MDASRRDFLIKVAKGAAYAAPVITSMSAPEKFLGQTPTTSQKMGGMSKGKGSNPDLNSSGTGFQTGASDGTTAPWSRPPDGGTPSPKAPWSTSSGKGPGGPPGG